MSLRTVWNIISLVILTLLLAFVLAAPAEASRWWAWFDELCVCYGTLHVLGVSPIQYGSVFLSIFLGIFLYRLNH